MLFPAVETVGGVMAGVEPIIVVLGPFGGGTSAVAKVLHHLGVFMGAEFDWAYREPHETWEDSRLSRLCGRAFSVPGGQLQMDADSLKAKLRSWADDHRRAARSAGCRPGVKHPLLCVAVDFIREAWGPVVPVVVDRPFEKVVASLNRLGWWKDEQERAESTAHLIAARDLALAETETVRVGFEALRAAPDEVIRRLADELHLKVTDAQVEAAVQSIMQPADVRDADPYGIDLLLARVERNPEDVWPVSILAQIHFDTGDFVNARKWYARQIEIGGTSEESYFAMWRIAECMARLDTPWPDVQDAFLRAWESRPTRAEPLYQIAVHYRVEQQYQLGYLFAERAAQIPLPEEDMSFDRDIYAWRAIDEQAVCASWIGKHAEAFALCRRLLARPDLPDERRQGIAHNRDVSVPAMIEAASAYPDVLVGSLVAGPRDAEVTVSLVAGPDRAATEQTLDSFLHCCTDVSRVGRFVVLDVGLSALDRARLRERYGFLEFVDCGPGAQFAQLREQIGGRFWLHLGQGWRFFAPEDYITRLSAVLDAEPQVVQVGINYGDAVELTNTCAAEQEVRRAPDAGRYVLTDQVANGPAMFDTTRLDRAGGVEGTDPDPLAALGRRATAAALQTASLDEVLCITV
jgi:tetratricopeptide (TPR) repeat protein